MKAVILLAGFLAGGLILSAATAVQGIGSPAETDVVASMHVGDGTGHTISLVEVEAVASTPVEVRDPAQVIARLKARYETIDAIRAEFVQTMRSAFMDEEAATHGVLIAQGDRYRVETDGQTLVTDGVVTWVYLRSQQQVLINDYAVDDQTLSISDFLFNFDDTFEASTLEHAVIEGQRHSVLTLAPRSRDAFFTRAVLSVRESDTIVTRLEVEDVNGTTMVFDLTYIQLNPPLGRDVFTFTPPAGTEVIDLRS